MKTWKLIFSEATNIQTGFGRDPGDGEFAKELHPSLCAFANVDTSGRYIWEGTKIVERPEWETEEVARQKEAYRIGLVCGPLQFRKALRAAGIHATAAAYVNGADEETQEAWEYAGEFKRLDPFILAAQVALDKTDEEVDALFQLALTF